MTADHSDIFKLYDLTVTVVGDPVTFACKHVPGVAFEVQGEDVIWTQPRFSLYALAAMAPLLPAKQRETVREDWMTTDVDVACPDPNCGARFRIERTGQTSFRHGETTKTRLRPADTHVDSTT
jgi:uncharacterized repeat protein (TIGR04076 family)